MKVWASRLLLFLLPTTLTAKELVVLEYDELQKLVETNSRDVKAAGMLTEASATRQGYQARARFPKLDVASGLRAVRELDGSGDSAPFFKVEGSMSLYRGNRDALKDSIQEKETAIRKEETQLVSKNQLSLARELYIRLASVRELKRAWADAMKMAQLKKKSSKVKVEAGLTTNTDVLEFELHESTLNREKLDLDKEEHEVTHRLQLVLGLPKGREIALSRTFSHPPEPQAHLKFSPESHPLVRRLSLQTEQAREAAKANVSKWNPDVQLYANYEEYWEEAKDAPGSLPRRDFAAGVRLSIPIGDNLTIQNEAAAKNLEASAYALQKEQSERQIEATFDENLHDMKVLHQLIHDSEEQLRKAKRLLKQTTAEYERGVKNGPDVLEASRTLYRIEVESIQLIFDYYLAEVSLQSLISR
jgi:outer membrane protein TolC